MLTISPSLKDLGVKIVAAIKAKLKVQDHIASGNLQRSIESDVVHSGASWSLDIYAESYADFVERRRRTGPAPFQKILQWVLLRKVYERIEKFRGKPISFAWAVIRNKIKYGTPTPNRANFGHGFISDTIEKDMKGEIDDTIDRMFFDGATTRIDNLMKVTI